MVVLSWLTVFWSLLIIPSHTPERISEEIIIYEEGEIVAKISIQDDNICFYKRGICVGTLSKGNEILVGKSYFTKGWIDNKLLLDNDRKKVLRSFSVTETESGESIIHILQPFGNICGIISTNTIQTTQGKIIATWTVKDKTPEEINKALVVYAVYFSDWKLC